MSLVFKTNVVFYILIMLYFKPAYRYKTNRQIAIYITKDI